MRYLLLLALSACMCMSVNGQEKSSFVYNGTKIELSKKMLNAYSAENLQKMEDSNPNLLLYLNYFVDHSYQLMNRETFQKPLSNVSELGLSEKFKQKYEFPNDFEILKYNLILRQEAQYFELNAKQMVHILPQKTVMDNFNEYRNTLNH